MTDTIVRQDQSEDGLPPRVRIPMLLTLMVASFLCLFNETVLSVGNNAIMAEWRLDYNTVQWTMSAFLVAMSVSVPIAAFVIHRFSARAVFATALALITVGLVLNAHAVSFAMLISGRVVEGLGAGLLPSLLFSAALALTRPAAHGFVTALCGVVIGLGPSLAPLYSGAILSAGLGWRFLFVPLYGFSLVLLVVGLFLVRELRDRQAQRGRSTTSLDILSVLLSVIGFTSLVGGINLLAISLHDWLGYLLTLLGLLICTLWGRRQLSLGRQAVRGSTKVVPVLNLLVLRRAAIVCGLALIILIQVANMALAVIYPMAVEPGLRLSPLASSLMLMVPLIISQLFALFAGRLFDRFGAAFTVTGGLLLLVLGFVLLVFARVSMGPALIALFAALAFVGVAFAMPTIQARMFSLVEPAAIPDVVSAAQTSMQVGGALGTTVTMGVFQASLAAAGAAAGTAAAAAQQSYLTAFGTVSLVLVVVYALSLVLAHVLVRPSQQG